MIILLVMILTCNFLSFNHDEIWFLCEKAEIKILSFLFKYNIWVMETINEIILVKKYVF